MQIFISLAAANPTKKSFTRTESYGPANLELKFDGASETYSVTWVNKMSNITTKLTKIGDSSYVVENVSPRTPQATFTYKEIRESVMAFFINCDLTRISNENVTESRRTIGDLVKQVENKRTLNLSIKNITFNKEHKAMHKPVLVGANREQEGIMVGINWSGTRAKVALYDDHNLPTRIVEMDTSLIWVE